MNAFRIRFLILISVIFFKATASMALNQTSLPKIDSHRFDIKPVAKSTSGKIYLFESNQVIPKTGNLILIYEKKKPVMAFRVLKNDSGKFEFVAKRVRRYDDVGELQLKESYPAIEKLGDVIPPPPSQEALPAEAATELDEPAIVPDQTAEQTPEQPQSPSTTETSSDLSELDSESTPEQTNVSVDQETVDELDSESIDSDTIKALDEIEEENPGEDDEINFEIDETTEISPFKNFFSVGAGFFANSSNFSLSPVLINGFSISYGHRFANNVFIETRSIQDSFSFELGGIHYNVMNQDGNNDQYTLYPFYGNLLYQIHLSKHFTLNGYGGLTYNYMATAVNPGASLNSLQGFQVNFGLGTFYMIGPQWYVRADIGWDRLTAGLSVKW